MKNNVNDYEKISKIAYIKWQESGMPKGRDLDFWLEAEKEFYGKRKKKKVLKE